MAETKGPKDARRSGDLHRLHLVGLKPGEERPRVVVQALDRGGQVIHSSDVDDQGHFTLPEGILAKAHRIVIGAPAESGGGVAVGALRYRAQDFAASLRDDVLAVAEGAWRKWWFIFVCVNGRVRVCRRRPWWYDELFTLAIQPIQTRAFRASPRAGAAGVAAAAGGAAADVATLGRVSLPDLVAWPYRCQTVCYGTVEVYRRTCCCRPWVIDDLRLPELLRDLERLVKGLPEVKLPGRFPPPPPPPIDPLKTPIFKGGALNEGALFAAQDLHALRTLPRDQIPAFINARPYLLCRGFSCGRPAKVATGTINPDGTFNICWREFPRIIQRNCHDEYAYVVKQTIGGTTTTIYDGVAAGIWFHQGDDALLTSYDARAFSCDETGVPDGQAYVYLDLIGDTESHELITPASTGWDRVAAPGATSGLLFPNPVPQGHLRNMGGGLELTFNFSEGMKAAAVGARYYRVSVRRADEDGNPVAGDPYYFGDGLSWQKAVVTIMGIDIVPESLGPVTVNGVSNLYKIPFDTDADWTGSVRYHAVINTLRSELNVPADLEANFGDPAAWHLVTLEVFDQNAERLRPLATPATGQPGAESTKPFKFRRWFQPGGSVGDDTVEVAFGALTHLFLWDNRAPRADITRLVKDNIASDEECQFLTGCDTSTFAIEYRAYVPDERFQFRHYAGWQRGLNGATGSLPTPLSPSNVGEPPAAPANSGTNTFAQMLGPHTKCSFSVTLTTESKTTNGESFSYPHVSETASFALEIVPCPPPPPPPPDGIDGR